MSSSSGQRDGGTEKLPLCVTLCREADDLRSLHKVIGAKQGEEPWQYWDPGGIALLTSPVEGLLGICGFGGEPPPKPEVRKLSEADINAVPLVGFTLENGDIGSVQSAVMTVATGQIGGFAPLVAAQSGYHDPAIDVFAYVWSQLGRPQVWIRQPALGHRGSAAAAPPSLLPLAAHYTSFMASRLLRGVLG